MTCTCELIAIREGIYNGSTSKLQTYRSYRNIRSIFVTFKKEAQCIQEGKSLTFFPKRNFRNRRKVGNKEVSPSATNLSPARAPKS